MLLAFIVLLAQAAEQAKQPEGLSPAALAGIITAAATAGATLLGTITAWRKRKDEARKMENEEDSIVITQAQGANLILDATVKTLNNQVDREAARADRAEARAERAETRVQGLVEQVESEGDRADKAERALDACQREVADLRGGTP